MTIGTLVLYIAIIAILLTVLTGLLYKKHKSILMTFLQNFTGVLFIISGFVKAVDPLGTAYKMEQYFAEFESTFSGTWLNFLAPIFPWLSGHSATFSVVMIVFEIVLGVMLLLGVRTKLTAWAFLLLVVFFTFLTGFTYLTGYVPQGVNFFDFSNWGPYVSTNMKVTDCGCFGDFIKLEPKISFYKDLVLLVPALIFVFRHKDMHQLFTPRFRSALTWVTTAAFTLFCLYNFVWNLPVVDFRPFFVGQNIRIQKEREIEAAQNVEILAYKMTEKSTGKVVELPFDQYMKEFKNYPKEAWTLEQIQSEPTVKATKLTDFEVSDENGEDGTEAILSDENYSFMLVSYKLPGQSSPITVSVKDTLWKIDTVRLETNPDSFQLVRSIDQIQTNQETREKYTFDPGLVQIYQSVVNPLVEGAKAGNYDIYILTAYADPSKLADFRETTGTDAKFYTADDILLKTIIRSNPGILLLKNGEVIQKWHWRQFPGYEKVKATYIK